MHKEAGIKLKATKTKLFQKQVEYLGHIISEEGLGMKPSFLDKVINWPTPTTRKALATFLGFAGYHRNYIKDYAQLTNEMNGQKQTKKENPWSGPQLCRKNLKF